MRSTEPTAPDFSYQYALRLLTGRDYSVARIRTKLAARCVSESEVEAAIFRLQNEGWLDDRRYAERFAESALASGRFFGLRLRQEMRRRGVPVELIDEILKQATSEYDELDELRTVLERRYPGFDFSAAAEKEKRRVISWLQRHGFGVSAIMRVLRG
ncbi:MAG: regulatory protein RecX [Deltaproteobacteria bacterium]|nr:regulatory protein RecX [Deltaproteobacteria bacterium]